jgi:hypothetical protein
MNSRIFGNGVLEFLLDSSGIVRSVNLTEDLRVRATPEDMLKANEGMALRMLNHRTFQIVGVSRYIPT